MGTKWISTKVESQERLKDRGGGISEPEEGE
jgi:hypothetical protein